MMSVMIGSVTERLAPDSDFMTFDNMSTSGIVDLVSRDAARVRVAAAVTCLSGLFQVCHPVFSCPEALVLLDFLLAFWASYNIFMPSLIYAGSSRFTSTWFFGDLFV